MNEHSNEPAEHSISAKALGHGASYLPSGETLIKGLVTGVIVSAVTQTGRRIIRKVARSPVTVFGLGLVAGFLIHKNRKKIGLGSLHNPTETQGCPDAETCPLANEEKDGRGA